MSKKDSESKQETIRDHLYNECNAMAEYALKRGMSIPSSTIETIESFENEGGPVLKEDTLSQKKHDDSENKARQDLVIKDLVNVHKELSKIVRPATPQAISLLQIEQKKGFLKYFGPIPMVRYLILVAIVSLLMFIVGIVFSPDINNEQLGMYSNASSIMFGGKYSFFELFFLLSASGLGASFAALYKANNYIKDLTFDQNQQSSYWVRFLLGLISGLILAVFVSDKYMNNVDFLTDGIGRPLLAILGGFSADLVYTFLNRMVETLKSLFQGSTREMIANQSQEIEARLNRDALENQMKSAATLIQIQQEISAGKKPEDIQAKLSELFTCIMPDVNMPSQNKAK